MLRHLNSEQRLEVERLAHMAGMEPFMLLLDGLVREEERKLLTYDLQNGSERGLALLKAQIDGARKLHRDAVNAVEKLKRRHDARA
jgi:hypothetical protein